MALHTPRNWALAALLALGCSTQAPPSPTPSGNHAGKGGGGASGAPASGAGASAGAIGSGAGAGGSAAGSSGAGGFGGSLGGTSGNGGAGGSAGGALLTELAAALDGVRWELTCGATVEDGRVCEYATDCTTNPRVNFDKTVVFSGEAGKIYNVTLRWRGVVEPRKYLGGQSDGTHFRVGGTPDPDGSTNLFAVYSVEVSKPPMTYYLNDDTQTGHYVFPIDHTKTIEIEGGASVHLLDVDQVPPCYAARNCDPALPVCTPFIIAGIAPAPAAFDGQFIQMDVVSVTLKP